MKTTIDIADDLLARGKREAKRQKSTFRALVEEGLYHVLSGREKRAPFRWRPVTVKGKGLSVEYSDSGWADIRKAIHKDLDV